MDAFEIIKLLQELQARYNSPAVVTKADESNKKALEMLEALMEKFEDMKREMYDQKVMIRAQSLRMTDKNASPTFPKSPTRLQLAEKHRYSSGIRESKMDKSEDVLQSDADTRRIVKEIELTQLSKSSSDSESMSDRHSGRRETEESK